MYESKTYNVAIVLTKYFGLDEAKTVLLPPMSSSYLTYKGQKAIVAGWGEFNHRMLYNLKCLNGVNF